MVKHRLFFITLILLIAAFGRLWQLGEAPPGLQHDELFKAQEGQSIVTDGNFRLFYESNQGHEGGYVWLLALSYILFGNSLLMVKMPAFWCGMLTVALLYRLVREMYNFRVAIFASGFTAVSFWSIFVSRVGLRAVLLPVVILMVMWGLWRICYSEKSPANKFTGYEMKSRLKPTPAIFTGILLGFAIYTYTASIALYAAFAGFLITLAVFDRTTLKKRWRELFIVTVLGAGLTIPMISYRLNNPMGKDRLNSISRPWDEFKKGNPDELLDNAKRLAGMPFFYGDPEWRYNIAHRPLFVTPIGLLVYTGFLLMLLQVRRQPLNAMFVVLAIAGLVPSLLTVSAPSFLRSIATMPGIMLFIALSLDWIGAVFKNGFQLRTRYIASLQRGRDSIYAVRSLTSWNRVVWSVGIAAILMTAAVDWPAYFNEWVESDEVQAIYRDDLEQLAEYLREQDEKLVFVSSSSPEYLDPLIYLFSNPPDDTHVVWFKGGLDIVLNDEPALLFVSPLEPILPSHAEWLTDETGTEHVDTIYRQDGETAFEVYRISAQGNALENRLAEVSKWQIYSGKLQAFPTANLADWAAPYEYPVNFGNVLQLVGVEMPKTTIPDIDNGVDNGLNLQLYLQPLVEDYNVPLSLFVHIIGLDGQVAKGRDFLGVPANWWSEDIIFIQDNYIGSYRLTQGRYFVSLGLYRTDTGERYPVLDKNGNIVGDYIILGQIDAVPQ